MDTFVFSHPYGSKLRDDKRRSGHDEHQPRDLTAEYRYSCLEDFLTDDVHLQHY